MIKESACGTRPTEGYVFEQKKRRKQSRKLNSFFGLLFSEKAKVFSPITIYFSLLKPQSLKSMKLTALRSHFFVNIKFLYISISAFQNLWKTNEMPPGGKQETTQAKVTFVIIFFSTSKPAICQAIGDNCLLIPQHLAGDQCRCPNTEII